MNREQRRKLSQLERKLKKPDIHMHAKTSVRVVGYRVLDKNGNVKLEVLNPNSSHEPRVNGYLAPRQEFMGVE